MDNFIDIVELSDIVDRLPEKMRAKNFEQLYSNLHNDNPNSDEILEIQDRVYDYFKEMKLPENEVTIYDFLVLSLRPRDLIATFNWDPFLYQAFCRNRHIQQTLFSMLNKKGFEVYLVNARQTKNVSGRKTDEGDAMWIQKLHSCGLLKSSYLPVDEQEALRTLVRYRHTLVQDCSRFKNRMQKSLELMNIKFHTLFSEISGKTSTSFIEAIINGERKWFLLYQNNYIQQ